MKTDTCNDGGELLQNVADTCTHTDNGTESEQVVTELWCSHCGNPSNHLLPLPPLYGLKLAAELIPCAYTTLKWALCLNKHLFNEPIFRYSSTGRRYRLLTIEELRIARQLLVRNKRSVKKNG